MNNHRFQRMSLFGISKKYYAGTYLIGALVYIQYNSYIEGKKARREYLFNRQIFPDLWNGVNEELTVKIARRQGRNDALFPAIVWPIMVISRGIH